MSVAPGTRLGPYSIAGKLGEGGMGEVYRGTDTRLGRDVAIKILPVATTASPDAIARFEREGRAIAALNHPNICTLFDVGTEDGRPYLVMELLAGASLHQVLAGGPLPLAALIDHAIALADALHAAHSRGIIHRDLKPANVFLTEHDTIKILDFGLAKADSERAHETATIDAALTGPGTTLGTLSYMSPEQLRGHAMDARSDLFSLGLVLYEMATGRRAFRGKTLAEVSAATLHDESPAPSTHRADLPEKLDEIILKLLEKDRDLRYQSAAELRGDLKRLKRRDPAPSDLVHSGAARPVPPSPPPSSSDAALAVGLVRRHPLAIAGFVLALLATAGAAWWALGRDAGPSTEHPQISIEALTLDGHAGHATISPDARFIAYVRRDLTHASVVVKQLGSNSEVVILPPSTEADYFAPSFTPDGSYVDVLVDARRNPEDNRFIVRVPFLGGAPRRIVERAASGIGWSPDGRQMAFVRVDRSVATRMDLLLADTDGQNERVLLTVHEPRQLATSFHGGGVFAFAPSSRPAWSPDGRTIALSGINQQSVSAELIEVDAATGAERAVRAIEASVPVFSHEFAYVSNARLIASRVTADGTQQWWVHPHTDPPVQLTPDLVDVRGVQLTGDRSAGVATRTIVRATVAVGTLAERTFVEAVAPSPTRPFFAQLDAAGRLFYAARVPGDIATFRSDGVGGAGTAIATDLSYAVPAPDGSFVVGWRRNRDLVRVNADGSGLTVLLRSSAIAFPVAITPDGESLVMVSNTAGPQQPWLLPLNGGQARRLATINIPAPFMRLSRDGRQTIFPSAHGTQLCRFPTFDQCRTLKGVRSGPLSADGRTVFAIDPTDPRNIIAQPIDGGPPSQLTSFTDMTIEDFSLSPDGNRIAITRVARESDVVLIKGLQ
jgi:serine/threonine protein kinase/Tol biopolymer transport system component